jgi:transcription-repair coupling factor (superfamily II helicase)
MEAVGYDLYIKILEKRSTRKRASPKPKMDCTVDIAGGRLYPREVYKLLKNPYGRLQKIANIENDEDRDDLLDELTDRFGDLPKPAKTWWTSH